jgi:uncharacterized protein with PQ loop repeat
MRGKLNMNKEELMEKFNLTEAEYNKELSQVRQEINEEEDKKLIARLLFTAYLVIQAYHGIYLKTTYFVPAEFVIVVSFIALYSYIKRMKILRYYQKYKPVKFYLYILEKKGIMGTKGIRGKKWITFPFFILIFFGIFLWSLYSLLVNGINLFHFQFFIGSIVFGLIIITNYFILLKYY